MTTTQMRKPIRPLSLLAIGVLPVAGLLGALVGIRDRSRHVRR